jgi:hypothetical protein
MHLDEVQAVSSIDGKVMVMPRETADAVHRIMADVAIINDYQNTIARLQEENAGLRSANESLLWEIKTLIAEREDVALA